MASIVNRRGYVAAVSIPLSLLFTDLSATATTPQGVDSSVGLRSRFEVGTAYYALEFGATVQAFMSDVELSDTLPI